MREYARQRGQQERSESRVHRQENDIGMSRAPTQEDPDSMQVRADLRVDYLERLLNRNRPTYEQVRAVSILDRVSESGPFTNLDWGRVRDGAAERVMDPDRIQQGSLSACGPAAIVNGLAAVDPIQYARLVLDIFKGKGPTGKGIAKSIVNGRPVGHQVDWMVLSAMRADDSNGLGQYSGKTEDQASGITWPAEMQEWMHRFLGVTQSESETAYFSGGLDELQRAGERIQEAPDRTVVMVLLSANKMMEATRGGGGWQDVANKKATLGQSEIPNHWVRLTSAVTVENDIAEFEVFTWGDRYTLRINAKDAASAVSEVIVGTRAADR